MENSAEQPNLKYLTNEELLTLSREGDDIATAMLISRMIPFVMSRAAACIGSGLDIEDLAQEGMIGLVSAIHNYDGSNNITFRTFAKICIDRRIYSAIKSSFRQKHMPLNNYISISAGDKILDIAGVDFNFLSNPEDVIIAEEDVLRLRTLMKEALSDFELEVLEQYLSGCTYDEIAAQIRSSVKSVDNALQRVRRKLRKSARPENI